MNVPSPLPGGEPAKRGWDKVREILAYLRSIRLVAGPGIRLRQTTAGTIVEATATAGGSGGGGTTPAPDDTYRGSFAIVRNADGTYQICNNSGSVPHDNRIRINSVEYTVPITAIAANAVTVFLRIDLTGDVPVCTISTDYSTTENVLVYAIGTVSATGTIWQTWTAGELDLQTPVVIDPSLSAFLAVTATNRIKFNNLPGAPYTGLWVPVMNNGIAFMAPCAMLDDAAYQETTE